MVTRVSCLQPLRVPPLVLPGESANGDFPDTAVRTMAAIVANAEVGVDYYSQYSFIRYGF